MRIVDAVLGLIVLLFGRPLYWAFVGIVGFLIGLVLAEEFLAGQQRWLQLLAALGAGVLGALLAVIALRVGFAVAGLLAGGHLAATWISPLAGSGSHLLWFAIGAVVGAILAAWVMDWAIIVLSSLVGAGTIVDAFDWAPETEGWAFVILVTFGILAQANMMNRRETATGE